MIIAFFILSLFFSTNISLNAVNIDVSILTPDGAFDTLKKTLSNILASKDIQFNTPEKVRLSLFTIDIDDTFQSSFKQNLRLFKEEISKNIKEFNRSHSNLESIQMIDGLNAEGNTIVWSAKITPWLQELFQYVDDFMAKCKNNKRQIKLKYRPLHRPAFITLVCNIKNANGTNILPAYIQLLLTGVSPHPTSWDAKILIAAQLNDSNDILIWHMYENLIQTNSSKNKSSGASKETAQDRSQPSSSQLSPRPQTLDL